MNDDAAHATRFIGLAPVGDASKQKFIHAISPTPASTMSSTERYLPNHQTPPYLHIHKQNQKKNLLKVFLIHSIGNMMSQKDKNLEVEKVEGRTNSRSKECWFCLSSPNVESHLITSVGENCYCALAKGPLVQDHVLILPIEHLPNTLTSPPECEIELVKFQKILKDYFKSHGKEVVFFEWVYVRATHANLQAIPVPLSRASVVQDIFNLAAEKLGFKFMVLKSDKKKYGEVSQQPTTSETTNAIVVIIFRVATVERRLYLVKSSDSSYLGRL
ncbi:unnamed protein product [Lactuca virosa]|uniref:Cwf19-like C-terminal domain-containing protein n=1 Tax=Lactuca virosa TaxID=75947 RepID=A0AAU9LV50_9ASTR|nr:unnamed protein product [Lactuca virosa]